MTPQSTVTLHTGREMPVLGLGTWQLTNNTAETIVEALRFGYWMIDTSGDYGTQPGIRDGLQQSAMPRESFYLVTKVEETEDAYESTIKNVNELGLQYADLMLIHRPPRSGAGVELWEGLIRAKEEGFTKDIGVSNYTIEQIQELMDVTGEKPVVNQIEWSPFGYSQEMLDFTRQNDIIIQAYSPLTRAKRIADQPIIDIAESYNKTPAQLLLRWNLQLGIVPLPKANRTEHLSENIDIFDFEISEDDMRRLDEFNEHYSSLGTLPYV